MADRQQIIETNKSLRLIKNELENLLEKGVIDDKAYESIHDLLPAEASLRAGATTAPRTTTPATSSSPVPPANALANLSLHNADPPSYAKTGPPSLPQRSQPPPPPPPSKPVLTHARALYRYAGADARDCAFEKDDCIAVHEYMNADWWMGRNLRTGQEGIFPRNYVQPEAAPPAPGAPANNGWVDEKAGYNSYNEKAGYNGYGQQQPPPNPYNSQVPPMSVANEPPHQQQGGEAASAGGKTGEMGKKFGKKLGNAAIFGAGATIGSNIVNSIF